MRPVLPWIAAYLAILVVWALMILRRTGPTLWKGRSLVALNIAFVVFSTAVAILNGWTAGYAGNEVAGLSPGFIAFDLVLILIAVLVRNTWLLIRTGHAATALVVERCFMQTRAPWTRRPGGYAIQCGEAEMMLTIRPTLLGPISVRFTGAADSRKAALVRSLFGKQFHRSFPTPRIRA